MTQEKMRRIVTACVSAATVLLVLLFSFLIYQWITIAVKNDKIKKVEQEIQAIQQQIALLEDEEDSYDLAYLKYQLILLEEKKDLYKGK